MPLAGARREVADRDAEPSLIGQSLELRLPQATLAADAAAAVGGDQQLRRGRVQGSAHLLPPVAHAGHGKGGRRVIYPDTHHTDARVNSNTRVLSLNGAAVAAA